jgi:cytochrome c
MYKKIIACFAIFLVFGECGDTKITEGAELFKVKCATCHMSDRPTSKAEMDALIAPPMVGAMYNVYMNFNTQEEANAFLKDYIMNPTKEKAICKENKLLRFGLMPSQKGLLSDEELDKIIEYLNKTYGIKYN